MKYNAYYRNAVNAGVTPAKIERRAARQVGSYAVLSTEEPTGPQRQVLLCNGMQGRTQIPLCVGSADSVRNIVGSVRLRTQGQQVVGSVVFASDDEAQTTKQRYNAGELVLSLITSPIAGVELRRGESYLHIVGPAIVLTAWEPLQAVLG